MESLYIFILLIAYVVCGCDAQIPVCDLPLNYGGCGGSLLRYGYVPAVDDCVSFVYGGCGGNENNFKTLAECQEQCRKLITWQNAFITN